MKQMIQWLQHYIPAFYYTHRNHHVNLN